MSCPDRHGDHRRLHHRRLHHCLRQHRLLHHSARRGRAGCARWAAAISSAVCALGLLACGGGGDAGTASGTITGTTTGTIAGTPAGTPTGTGSGTSTTGAGRLASYAVVPPDAPHLYPVNPAASWKPLLGELDGMQGAVSVIDLSTVVPAGAALAGARLTVQAVGAYDATANSATPQWLANVSAVFVDAQGMIVAPVSGPDAPAPAYVRECANSTPATDPVAGDFLVPAAAPAVLVVPPAAAFLRVSVDDCYFADNRSAATDPLRIFIRAEPS